MNTIEVDLSIQMEGVGVVNDEPPLDLRKVRKIF